MRIFPVADGSWGPDVVVDGARVMGRVVGGAVVFGTVVLGTVVDCVVLGGLAFAEPPSEPQAAAIAIDRASRIVDVRMGSSLSSSRRRRIETR
jgi:hypothetical protein